MMVVTADSRVPQEVVDALVAGDGFEAGRTSACSTLVPYAAMPRLLDLRLLLLLPSGS